MNMTTWIMIGVLLGAAGVGIVIFYRKRQKALFQSFEQIAMTLRQIPKQKKQSFLLFMFKESAKAGKNTPVNLQGKVSDPKYLEVQLLQMSSILKDRSKVKDKKMKQALQMYDTYQVWEKKLSKKTGVA